MQLGAFVGLVGAGLALLAAGCAGGEAPPPEATAPPPPVLSEAEKEKQTVEAMQLQLATPLSPAFVPVLVRKPGAAPEALPVAASQTLCAKAAKARKGKDADAHLYCIEAHKDGRRVVHPLS